MYIKIGDTYINMNAVTHVIHQPATEYPHAAMLVHLTDGSVLQFTGAAREALRHFLTPMAEATGSRASEKHLGFYQDIVDLSSSEV